MYRRLRFFPLIALLTLGLAPLASQELGESRDLDSRLAKAFDLFEAGNYAESAEIYAAIGSLQGDVAVDAAYREILARINAKDLSKAESLTDAFLTAHPEGARAIELRYQLGRISFLRGRYEEAMARFSDFAEAWPQSSSVSSALFWKAESLYQLGKTKESFQLLSELLSTYPDSPKRDLIEWRLEVIGLEARRALLQRTTDYSKVEELQRLQQGAQEERRREQGLEREHLLFANLRALYGFAGVWKIPLYAEGTVVEAAPVEPAVDPALVAAELAKANRLQDLLATKAATLELLTATVSAYAEEVSK